MTRRKLDQYMTPAGEVASLLERVAIRGRVLEPCAGNGELAMAITKGVSLATDRPMPVVTNDLDLQFPADYHVDARCVELYQDVRPQWVVTNPPFNQALDIFRAIIEYGPTGIALLLRLSWLEPTYERSAFPVALRPSRMIVLPRISFNGNGRTDSVTCAWFVWEKFHGSQSYAHGTVSPVLKRR